MTRVSTYAQSQTLLASSMRRQTDLFQTQNQVSTGKKATVYACYAPQVSGLVSARAAKAAADSHVSVNKQLTTKLDLASQQLTRLLEAAQSAKQSVLTAVANGQADGAVTALEADTQTAIDALNAEFDGQFLFGGARGTQKPVTVQSLAGLASLASPAAAFQNDTVKASMEVSEGVDLRYGQLADEIAAPLFASLQRIGQLNAATPLTGKLTSAQETALTAEISALDSAIRQIVDQQAQLGIAAKKVEDYTNDAQTRADNLDIFISDIEDVNMAEALTRLNNDRTALEASYKVTGELSKLSLLNYI